ncbi:MAG: hypothetical protein AB7V62_04550 [Thermoleophilia bacterium]
MPEEPPDIVAAPGAPAGAADATRRWAVAFPDGRPRFAGVTRPEGARAAPALLALGEDGWDDGLVEVALPVVLSDGAGPYLIDAAGRITLVLAPHPAILGAHVAMGVPSPGHRVGIAGRAGEGAWRWLARADVDAGDRVAALDDLDACPDLAHARRWAALRG